MLGRDLGDRLGFRGDAARQQHRYCKCRRCKYFEFHDVTSSQSARRLLVVVVFLPEPLFEFRIGFLFGGLAQSFRDDVIVAASSNLLRTGAAASGTLLVAVTFGAIGIAFVVAALR